MYFSRLADALYWCVITASTVGYGDYFPTTDLGKLFSTFYLSGKQTTSLA